MNQRADLVLGQPDFVSSTLRPEGPDSLNLPVGIASDGTHLWVGDGGFARVLQWNSVPTSTTGAALALGQLGMSSHIDGTARDTMFSAPSGFGVATDGTRLWATDPANNRVLMWTPIPSSGSGALASVVLGQGCAYDTNAPSVSATALRRPTGLWTDGVRLIVADTDNHRVLIWHTLPACDTPADAVLGQPDMTSGGSHTTSAKTLRAPTGVFFDGTQLYVADTGNNRVVVWAGIPPAAAVQPAAAFALGQTSLVMNAADAGYIYVSSFGMHSPSHVYADPTRDVLFVTDTGNERVMVYRPIPRTQPRTVDQAAAVTVLGGYTFTPDPYSFNEPRGITLVGNRLFVVDAYWNRVLGFTISP